jgi:hypothetical protein
MKLVLSILGLINASYMLLDGIYVLLKGKYIGPEKPGPWASLFTKMNVDVFKLGPLFIVFGLMWFVFIYGLQTTQSWSYYFGIGLSICTFWYLPIGTLISVMSLVLLVWFKSKIGQ